TAGAVLGGTDAPPPPRRGPSVSPLLGGRGGDQAPPSRSRPGGRPDLAPSGCHPPPPPPGQGGGGCLPPRRLFGTPPPDKQRLGCILPTLTLLSPQFVA